VTDFTIFTALWGLDGQGNFIHDTNGGAEEEDDDDVAEPVENKSAWRLIYHKIKSFVVRRKASRVSKASATVAGRIKADLCQVIEHTNREIDRFEVLQLSDREKSKRILYHFQKDLTAGLSGISSLRISR
jgi:hypothetical protein